MTLKQKFSAVADNYLREFKQKQDLDFDGWTGDYGWANFVCQYAFTLDDIRYDIDNNCPVGMILDWQNDNITDPNDSINYHSYYLGLRLPLKKTT